MSNLTTFYTPGTGLPDLEMRIALGLCAASLNAFDPEKVTLYELDDRYCIEINENHNAETAMARSLAWICSNKLADERIFGNLPGVHTRWYKSQAKNVAKFGKWLFENPTFPESMKNGNLFHKEGATSSACGHPYNHDDEVFTALLVLSPHIGKPPVRNSMQTVKNLPICPYCGVLALAGAAIFQICLSIQKTDDNNIFFLPRFSGRVQGEILSSYLAATKHLRNSLYDIPAMAGILVLLGNYPNVVDILCGEKSNVHSFFVSRYQAERSGARYEKLLEQSIRNEEAFLFYSPYNRALLLKCYKDNNRSELLAFLARSLQNYDIKSALDFARTYVSSTEGKAMLPLSTTEFLLKEVCKMDKTLLEGEKFKVIKEVADMLQHFVRERNFGYVDNLRKARDADEFGRLLLDAQREAQSVMLDPKKQIKPYLPGQNTVQRVLQIVNEDEKQFKSVQTLVALLAFTYYKKEV
ncbi:MAG: hypothetical protein O8C63_03410 [Candidatus Methanoperedens sp.]|nr:hypothetical protein [Candidatus Methanoperedens sp.]